MEGCIGCASCKSKPALGFEAITEEMLARMPVEEGGFWREFLDMAQNEFERAKRKKGIQPSLKLLNMYKKALSRYNGEEICQVHSLKRVFAF